MITRILRRLLETPTVTTYQYRTRADGVRHVIVYVNRIPTVHYRLRDWQPGKILSKKTIR